MFLHTHYANDNPPPRMYYDELINTCWKCNSDHYVSEHGLLKCGECGQAAKL